MSDRDRRVQVARIEASEHASRFRTGMLVIFAIYGAVLATMAYFGVQLEWLMVVGFVLGAWVVCEAVHGNIYRFDAGRAYLEQTCSTIEDKIDSR
jgi:hypothetical protein